MANNDGAAQGQDRLLEVFREVDHIHHHVLEDHGCSCEELKLKIVDLWSKLVDWNWDKLLAEGGEKTGEA